MYAMEWLLDVVLVVLLVATLFHAIRLERALGVLKRDRAELLELIASFNASSREAEIGIERLRGAVDGAGQQIAHQVDAALALKGDLVLLIERGNQLADRMDTLVHAGRPLAGDAPRLTVVSDADAVQPRVRSQAERDLLKALRMAR
jgi:uncharacterized protein DUF6468